MKIGASGLQAVITQEAVRKVEPNIAKNAADKAVMVSEDPNIRKQLYNLNKAVERMTNAARAYHQPFDFVVKRSDKPKIKMTDKRTGAERELTLEEAEAWSERIEQLKGKNMDGYV